MVGAVANVVEAVSDAGEEVIDTNRICTSCVVAVVKLLKPVV
jgi:hypothetical protein